ncbi:MAG TPA: hypothetical protein VGF86_02380 [Candidatus Tumulicola sp.]
MSDPITTLHVTNGDSVLYLFKKAGIGGTHLAWRDSLNEGPVPAGLGLAELSATRAGYLSQRGYANPIKIIRDFKVRDAAFERARGFREIVLWFEHDLYDQLQLLQVMTALEDLKVDASRVTLIQSDHYLGMMTTDELMRLLPRRRNATPATFKSARRGWERFTSASPSEHFAAAREDAIGLPFLKAAMRRLCEEYPYVGDGLSRSQRQALAAVRDGPASNEDLFFRAQTREEAAFLGDTAFARILADLREPECALIAGVEGSLALTPLGERVLAGEADWLEIAGIDRWIGGVHLLADCVVRWDEESERLGS